MDSRYDDFFKNRFNTRLSPEEETKFREWAVQNKRDPDAETIDYDLRGMWKSGEGFSANGHGTDRFKKPNHPTFSEESMYHGTPTPSGGNYVGGRWTDPSENKRGTFTPSLEMLEITHPPELLKRYFKRVEPDYDLVMPEKRKQGGFIDKPLSGNNKLI